MAYFSSIIFKGVEADAHELQCLPQIEINRTTNADKSQGKFLFL